ncbi:MAG: DUF98 domain-containing protein [Gammaproteobacteria bacterium]|nr:DUF98 domain-containing protein [Gammaproteobacteria bacterium]
MTTSQEPVVCSGSGHDNHFPGDLILEKLNPLQKIMLSADGTLTKLLEVYLDERMRIIKLMEKVFPAPQAIDALELEAGHDIIERKILLQGESSGRAWLYADSVIVPERLEKRFRDQLLNSHVPIGKLWLEHKIETYKELITTRRETAGDMGVHFQLDAREILLSRTYRVFCQRMPVMMITEKFPEHYFKCEKTLYDEVHRQPG